LPTCLAYTAAATGVLALVDCGFDKLHHAGRMSKEPADLLADNNIATACLDHVPRFVHTGAVGKLARQRPVRDHADLRSIQLKLLKIPTALGFLIGQTLLVLLIRAVPAVDDDSKLAAASR
jgi:hypothetical protein